MRSASSRGNFRTDTTRPATARSTKGAYRKRLLPGLSHWPQRPDRIGPPAGSALIRDVDWLYPNVFHVPYRQLLMARSTTNAVTAPSEKSAALRRACRQPPLSSEARNQTKKMGRKISAVERNHTAAPAATPHASSAFVEPVRTACIPNITASITHSAVPGSAPSVFAYANAYEPNPNTKPINTAPRNDAPICSDTIITMISVIAITSEFVKSVEVCMIMSRVSP